VGQSVGVVLDLDLNSDLRINEHFCTWFVLESVKWMAIPTGMVAQRLDLPRFGKERFEE